MGQSEEVSLCPRLLAQLVGQQLLLEMLKELWPWVEEELPVSVKQV